MSSIVQLPPELLERIAIRLEWKSYFRIQQTCHYMAAFFQNNQKIKIHMPDDFSLDILWNNNRNEPEYYANVGPGKCSNFSSLYGARFAKICIQGGSIQLPKNCMTDSCTTLKKYRITSIEIDTYYMYLSGYSADQYEEMLKIMKPEKVRLQLESNLFEVLLKAKRLKDVFCTVYLHDIPIRAPDPGILELPSIMEHFLKKFRVLRMDIYANQMSTYFELIKKVLKYLREPLPNLRYFSISGMFGLEPLPPADIIPYEFGDLSLNLVDTYTSGKFMYKFECLDFGDRLCELKIGKTWIYLKFKYADDDDVDEGMDPDY